MEPGTRNQEPEARSQGPGSGSQESGFRRLIAWQRADDLASAVYKMGDSIPGRDQWLRTQILKAAHSISSNIADGHGRGTLRDYLRFLEMAVSSLNEVENDLHFLKRNEIVGSPILEPINPLRVETGKLLMGLLKSLRAKLKSNGDWQRHYVGEERIEYGVGPTVEDGDDNDWLPAPGS